MRLMDFCNICPARFVKNSCRENKYKCIDKEGCIEGDGAVDEIQFQYTLDACLIAFDLAGLHKRRVQVKIVRHDRCADNTNGDVQGLFVGDAGDEPDGDFS